MKSLWFLKIRVKVQCWSLHSLFTRLQWSVSYYIIYVIKLQSDLVRLKREAYLLNLSCSFARSSFIFSF